MRPFVALLLLGGTLAAVAWMVSQPRYVAEDFMARHPPAWLQHSRLRNMRKVVFVGHVLDTAAQPDVRGFTSTLSWTNVKRRAQLLFAAAPEATFGDRPTTYLVHTADALSPAQRAAAETVLGAQLERYLPHNTYAVRADHATALRLADVDGVLWVGRLPAEARVAGELGAHLAMSAEQLAATVADTQGLRLDIHINHRSSDAVAAFAESLPAALAANWRLVPVNDFRLSATYLPGGAADPAALARDLKEMVAWAAEHDDCFSVAELPRHKLHNSFAVGITQSGNSAQRSIWNRGLTGQNMIVGCSDSGLDFNHCLFKDTSTNTFGSGHRKIVNYVQLPGNDMTDDAGGHGEMRACARACTTLSLRCAAGTHVVGSIVGNANDAQAPGGASAAVRDHSGAAKDAKVFFQDIGLTGGGLNVPDDIKADIFMPVFNYNAEARVHSNSWGASTNSYTSNSQSVDDMVYSNPDMLILYAAGNDGQKAGSISGTVGAPATAKNALVVGASQTTTTGFNDSFTYTDWMEKRQQAAEQLKEPNLDCCADSRRGVQQYCCESFNRQSLATETSVRAGTRRAAHWLSTHARGERGRSRAEVDPDQCGALLVARPGQRWSHQARTHGAGTGAWRACHGG
jgi:hypothetical protein